MFAFACSLNIITMYCK